MICNSITTRAVNFTPRKNSDSESHIKLIRIKFYAIPLQSGQQITRIRLTRIKYIPTN